MTRFNDGVTLGSIINQSIGTTEPLENEIVFNSVSNELFQK